MRALILIIVSVMVFGSSSMATAAANKCINGCRTDLAVCREDARHADRVCAAACGTLRSKKKAECLSNCHTVYRADLRICFGAANQCRAGCGL
ncbi:MAG: hypothetical protein ACHQ9S_22380 [Candidatus Binatia bacterium]